MENKRIADMLQLQPLTDEEKTARHILGRLYGPIATSNYGTRNGRKYNKDLWEKALNDDVFKEKIECKSLFLELGHPTDREETLMEKACACIPELPKIINGDLYAYVDILDTPNGKILKTLCDYGFVPGISSRGSGDVLDNNEVDPETFFLETWDIVQLPAVKNARLAVCESYNIKVDALRKALKESYSNASEEDKQIMKDSLDKLDIDIDDYDGNTFPGGTPKDLNEIPSLEDDPEQNALIEATEEGESNITIEDEPEPEDEPEADTNSKADKKNPKEDDQVEVITVGDFIKELKDFDKKSELVIPEVVIDGKSYKIEFSLDENKKESKVTFGVNCIPEMDDNTNINEVNPDTDDVAELDPTDESDPERPDDAEAEAINNGEADVIESLKEMVRQKDLLEKKVKALKNGRAVDNIKVDQLKEELTKYKVAFERMSKVAGDNKAATKQLKDLTEQLAQKNKQISELQINNKIKLTENLVNTDTKIKTLAEKLTSTTAKLETSKAELTEQVAAYEKKVAERTRIAKSYKTKFTEALDQYINFRASMIGVKPTEIKTKLNESYTIKDIDQACDQLLTENVNISKLPFQLNSGSKIKLTESANLNKNRDPEFGYEIDDSLLELAGLK